MTSQMVTSYACRRAWSTDRGKVLRGVDAAAQGLRGVGGAAGGERIHRGGHARPGDLGEMGIAGGGLRALVPEQRLDVAQIDTGLQQMRGEAVTQRVDRHRLGMPQSATTRLTAVCAPQRSMCVVVVPTSAIEPAGFGNNQRRVAAALRCVAHEVDVSVGVACAKYERQLDA